MSPTMERTSVLMQNARFQPNFYFVHRFP